MPSYPAFVTHTVIYARGGPYAREIEKAGKPSDAHDGHPMRRLARLAGLGLIAAGVLTLAWVIVVWRWQDPFTGLYTQWKQHQLAHEYRTLVADWRPPRRKPTDLAAEKQSVAAQARAFQRSARPGRAIGRIVIGRIGLKMVVVEGTDHESLKQGPGLDPRSFMPGENRLVYIAGHRTTYLAPFAHIDDVRAGDYIRLEMPYATFTYRATGHMIVAGDDLAVLRSPHHELLRLQACHPRFFATHRYIVNAKLVGVQPRGQPGWTLAFRGGANS